MPRLIQALLIALLPLALPAAAQAHSPYFTQSLEITLPDGRTGQLRVLKGDGILGADPARAVILDAEGRSLARTPRTFVIQLVCDAARRCIAVDPGSWTTYEIDPASFRVGQVIRLREDAIWDLEHGPEAWGFRARPASLPELIRAEVTQAQELGTTMLPFVYIGAVFGLAMAIGNRVPASNRPGWRIAFVIWTILRVLMFIAAASISLLLASIIGITTLLWLALMAFGAIITAAPIIGLLRWRDVRAKA